MPAPNTSTAFDQAIEDALEHYADPAWLGANCPLAAPYVLGAEAPAAHLDARALGVALQHRLRSAAEGLEPDQRQLLDASFFLRNWQHNINGVAMTLNMSRAAYYRRRAAALSEFADAFAARLSPAMQFEIAQMPTLLLGRAEQLRTALEHLRAGHAVGISGPSGVGKTQLGQAIAAQFGQSFWFSVRPPLNDQLGSFVFALAHRLSELGATQTWRQLIADGGAVKPDVALGLLQADLSRLPAPLLLCVDEIDLLLRENPPHAALMHGLDVLGAKAPLLLIGQRQNLLTRHTIQLSGLEMGDALALLASAGVAGLGDQTAQQIMRATHGNPLLLGLFAALHAEGEPAAVLLRRLAQQPNVNVLLERLWQRQSVDERALWCSVAVCRQLAPRDAWRVEEAELDALIQLGLVREQAGAAVYVLPPVRDFVLAKADAALLESAHAHAAELYERRAEFTFACFHYVRASMPEQAVRLWFNHRERETGRGLAAAAEAIFAEVSPLDLGDDEARRALALLCAGWHKLAGRSDDGLAALGQAAWPHTHPQFGFAQRLRGNLQEMRGQLDQAAEAFRAGLNASAAQQVQERVRNWAALGYSQFRQREMRGARSAALQAQIEALDFRGLVEVESGNLAEAERVLREGLALAEQAQLDSQKWSASLHDRLGRVLWQTGRHTEAVRHLRLAMGIYEQMGDSITPLYQHMNLAAAYIAAEDYDAALEEAAASLVQAQAVGHAYLIAGLSLNAAEASFYLQQTDDAERYAVQTMNQEETAVQPYAFTVMGMVQRARAQLPASQSTLRTAIANAQQIEDRYAEACAWRELGLTLSAERGATLRPPEAQAAFESACALFEAMGLTNEVAKTNALRT